MDFEYSGRLFSIYGGSSFALADVLAMLGIDVSNDEIASAEFTRTSVLSITLENGIWMLNSHGAFTTSELLTVTTVDGTVYYINVADEAVTYNGTVYGNLADLSNSITVAVNGTNLNNEQARDKTFNLTFNYSMLFGNAKAALESSDGGTYNWCYDLSEMAAEYPEIKEFPNMTGTLRTGRTVLGTYEVKDNKVYLHVNESALGNPDAISRINGSFTINMALDANGTGSEDSTTFKFPGGGSFTTKYKPVEYENGTKSANPTEAVVYPDQYDNGYFYIDYTAELEEKFDLKSLVFEDVLGPKQELVASSVKVNGNSTSVTTGGDAATTGQTFSFDVLDALGMSKLPANTKATVTYTVRVKAEDIEAMESVGLKLRNDARWKINETTVPGGDTTVTITEKEYDKPIKTIKNESSTQDGGTVVNPNGDKKEIDGGVQAVKATMAMLNADGTYHISYGIAFTEGAVPKNMSLTDEYGSHQSLLTNSFTVTYNGVKYPIDPSYIQDNGTSYSISDLKAAIEAATGTAFVAGANYSINYETSVTAADFDVEITNKATLTMDKDYPTDETTITLTSEDFQPGTKRNATSKNITLKNSADQQTTKWEISITEPKKASTKAELEDEFPNDRMDLQMDTFKLLVNGTEYTVPSDYIKVSGNKFTFNLNDFLKDKNIGAGYVEAGVNYKLTYETKNKVDANGTNDVYHDVVNSSNVSTNTFGSRTLRNTAKWTFADGGDDSPQDGGEDTVTYTIPPYKPTGKSDNVTGNVAPANGKYGDASYYITGNGPYTIHYTITVPAQDRDLTSAMLTDSFTTNQTINWGSFRVNGAEISSGLTQADTYTEASAYADPDNPSKETFTLNLLAAMGIDKLEAGKAVTITYTATTDILDEKITNDSTWNFNGEYNDGPHHTEEKIVKPEYQPGSKSVYNANLNKEVPIRDEETGKDAEYSFDWTLTITEPTELTKAVLHDDYGTDSKAHTLTFPITVTANGVTKKIESESDAAIKNWNPTSKTFDIDMIALFGVTKFPANTTFTVKYSTKTTGNTIIEEGTYHNQGTWGFDGTIGKNDEPIPGGEAETILKTTEYNDGSKVAYYNGQRLYGGSFIADSGTVMDYVATIEQDYPVTTLTYHDEWNEDKGIKLLYPIIVEDSDGNEVARYENASEVAKSTNNSFDLDLVIGGKLPNSDDFEPGVTYFVRYQLDFGSLVGEDGEFDKTHIVNKGHWHTEGNLPDHDDDHPTDEEPKYPEWQPIQKGVASVKYTNNHTAPALVEVPLDKGEGDVWWTDAYTVAKDNDGIDHPGTFYIDYVVTMKEPRDVTSLVLTDQTNIPGGVYSTFREDSDDYKTKLTILDADGNIATYEQLGVASSPTQAVFTNNVRGNFNITNTGNKLGFTLDVISYLKSQLGNPASLTIPKNFTVKLEFEAVLYSNMDSVTEYLRVNRDTPWHNHVVATFNGTHDEPADADTTIKTRKSMTKTAVAAEDIGSVAAGQSVDGKNLGTDGQGKRVKYTITVGKAGDTFEKPYKVTDTLTNVFVQKLDLTTGISVSYTDSEGVARSVTYMESNNDNFYPTNYNDNGQSIPDGFVYTIPEGVKGPVTIVYYVTNIDQSEADTLNSDSASYNDVWGVQVEQNTVKNDEDKEITTTYEVEYTSDHDLTKNFQKWDKATSTATWKVEVTAENTNLFPKGYKITEDAFVYTSRSDAAQWTSDQWKYWVNHEKEYHDGTIQNMTLDLSKIIVQSVWYDTDVLSAGVDYQVVDNSIVFLRDISTAKIRVTGIRTTIPGYNEESTEKYYYYNDASIRTDHDSLLDEDDDNNDTDAVALLQKKFVEYKQKDSEVGDKASFTWEIIITPPKTGIKGWKLYEDDYDAWWFTGTTKTNNDMTGCTKFTVRTASGAELVNPDDYTGALWNNNPIVFQKNFTEPIIIRVKTYPGNDWLSGNLLNQDTVITNNKVHLVDDNEETVDEKDVEKEVHNGSLSVSKTVSGTEGELEADDVVYPTLKSIGGDLYEYTVKINEDKRWLEGSLTFTDLLPAGFELVDYNCNDDGTPSVDDHDNLFDVKYHFSNTDHDVYYEGGIITSDNGEGVDISGSSQYYSYTSETDEAGGTNGKIWATPEVETDSATGRTRLTLRNLGIVINGNSLVNGYTGTIVIKYKVRLTEPEQERLHNLTTGAVQYYENTASVTMGVRTGSASETVVYQYDEALDKHDVTDPGSASIGEITYEVYVNKEYDEENGIYTPRTLNKDEPLTLSDTINTALELDRQNIKVYKDTDNHATTSTSASWVEIPVVKPTETEKIKNGEGYALSYNSDSRVLTFKLADTTHFKVVIPCFAEDPTEDTNGDGEITDEDAAGNGWYKNTVTLVGEGRFEDEVDKDHVVYTAGGDVQFLEGTGFSIDKYDENNITKAMQGAQFQLYKVAEFSEEETHTKWPASYVIPEESEWEPVGGVQTTGDNGIVSWSGLDFTYPNENYPSDMHDTDLRDKPTGWNYGTGTDSETNGTHVTLYAWKEVGLSEDLINEGYTIGGNGEPHYIILYYTAKNRQEIAEKMIETATEGDLFYDVDKNSITWQGKGLNIKCADGLNVEQLAAVEEEFKREQKKALSSYNIAAAFDYNYEQTNFITVSTSKDGYKWPVPNTDLVSKTVTKLWDDYQDAKGVRPKATEVKVQLYQNGVKYGDEVTLKNTTISASNPQYSYTWENLPATDSTGKDYVYTVEEVDVDEHYTATYSDDTFTITNHLVDNSAVTATKVWDDDNNKERKRPQSIFYQLYQMDGDGNVREYGNEVEVNKSGLVSGWEWTGDSGEVTGSSNFTAKWSKLPQVDDPDAPTTVYTYFVLETKLKAQDGTIYWLDDATNKFYQHEGNVESGDITGQPLYSASVTDKDNIYTVTNTVISSKLGSLELVKTITGLVGNHNEIDVDGNPATEGMADAKTYYVKLINDEYYAIKAKLDIAKSTDTLKVYTYVGPQTREDDFTAFEISEKVKVRIDGLPMGDYIAMEITSGKVEGSDVDMAIKGYEFDARVSGESVTTVMVKPTENKDGNPPEEANAAELINNYIPDKGSIELTKQVTGLPEGTDLTQYRFLVVITVKNVEPLQYVNTDGSLTTTRVIHYVTPGTPTTIDNVPIGTYTVEELADDARMPKIVNGATYDEEENPGGVKAEVLAHYTIDADGSTTSLQAIVTKNGTRYGTIINKYQPKGDLIVNKTILNNGEGDPEDVGKTFKIGVFTDMSGETMVGEAQTITIAAGTGALAGKYVGSTTFNDLPYGTYYVYELDDGNNAITGETATINGVAYAVTKDSVSVQVGDEAGVVNIENDQQPQDTSLTVEKTWDILADTVSYSITYKVQYSADGVDGWTDYDADGDETAEIYTMTYTAPVAPATEGTYSDNVVNGLPAGYHYRAVETGYTVTVSGGSNIEEQNLTIVGSSETEGSGWKSTIANTLPKKEIEATKTWSNADLSDDATVTFQLFADGNEITEADENNKKYTVSIDKDGRTIDLADGENTPAEWTVRWLNLPKYNSDGTEIVYTVEEIGFTYGGVTYNVTKSESGSTYTVEADASTTAGNAVYTWTVTADDDGFTNAPSTTTFKVNKRFLSNGAKWNLGYDGGTIYYRLYKYNKNDPSDAPILVDDKGAVVPSGSDAVQEISQSDYRWLDAATVGEPSYELDEDDKPTDIPNNDAGYVIEWAGKDSENRIKTETVDNVTTTYYKIPYMKVYENLPTLPTDWAYTAVECTTSTPHTNLRGHDGHMDPDDQYWTCTEFGDVMALKNNLEDVKAVKEWDDSQVSGEYYHPAVTFKLYRTEVDVSTATGDDANDKKVALINAAKQVTGTPKKADIFEADGTTLKPGYTYMTGEDQTLPAGTDLTEKTWADLPSFNLENGNKYVYIVVEDTSAMTGYVYDGVNASDNTWAFKNKLESMDLYVHKTWYIGETNITTNQDYQEKLPQITYQVMQQGYDGGTLYGDAKNVTPAGKGNLPIVTTETNNQVTTTSYAWQERIDGLPKQSVVKDGNDEKIITYRYYVQETTTIDGFNFTTTYNVENDNQKESDYTKVYVEGSGNKGIIINNVIPKTKITVEKIWMKDEHEMLEDVPDTITVTLYRDNAALDATTKQPYEGQGTATPFTLKKVATPSGSTEAGTLESTTYSWAIDGLDKYYFKLNEATQEYEPTAYEYHVVEGDVSGWSLAYYTNGDKEQGTDNLVHYTSAYDARVEGEGTIVITNTQFSISLPSTGGTGTTIFYGAGLSLMLFAFLGFVLTARKRSGGDGI